MGDIEKDERKMQVSFDATAAQLEKVMQAISGDKELEGIWWQLQGNSFLPDYPFDPDTVINEQ